MYKIIQFYLKDTHAKFGCTPVQREKVLRVRSALQRLKAVDAGNDGGQNFRDLCVPKHVRVCQAQIRQILVDRSIYAEYWISHVCPRIDA